MEARKKERLMAVPRSTSRGPRDLTVVREPFSPCPEPLVGGERQKQHGEDCSSGDQRRGHLDHSTILVQKSPTCGWSGCQHSIQAFDR